MTTSNIYNIRPSMKISRPNTIGINANLAQGLTAPGNINLGNLSLANITLGNNDFFNNQYVKKYEIIETAEDLLVLSCAWHRIRKSNQPIRASISSLMSEQLFQNIEPEDHTHASEIRDYYSKKLMVLVLKEQRLTPFRQDLNTFLNSDSKKFTENFIPLVYRLPEFYNYDKKFDELRPQFESKITGEYRTMTVKLCTLTSVHKFRKNSKHVKMDEYWFKGDDGYAYRFALDPSNMLSPLWQREFDNGSLTGTFNVYMEIRDGFPYYKIRNIVQI